jgi:hypothetical protein
MAVSIYWQHARARQPRRRLDRSLGIGGIRWNTVEYLVLGEVRVHFMNKFGDIRA